MYGYLLERQPETMRHGIPLLEIDVVALDPVTQENVTARKLG